MASGKRASMREGPLAQLFRKTEEDAPGTTAAREERSRRASRARPPAPEDAPEPQPRAGAGAAGPRGARTASAHEPEFEQRATEAARRAEQRARRREEEPPRERGWSRYDGVPTPEERLR